MPGIPQPRPGGLLRPQLYTAELDRIMADIFNQLVRNKQDIIDTVVTVIQSIPDEHDYDKDLRRVEEDLSALQAKKDRLLEMSIEGIISMEEFKQRNDGFNDQVKDLEKKRTAIWAEAEKGRRTTAQLEEIKDVLEQELSFQNGINSDLAATILNKVIVKRNSTKAEIHLDIHLKLGGLWKAVFDREKSSFCCDSSLQYEPLDAGCVPPKYSGPLNRPVHSAPNTLFPLLPSMGVGTLHLPRTNEE